MVELTQDDVKRRRDLNEERNPRREVPNEATQIFNPLTRKPYLGDDIMFEMELDHEHLRSLYPSSPYFEKSNISYFPGKDSIQKPTTTEFIEYQLALARKDVRDGKMNPMEYKATRARVSELVKRMNEADVPLSVLSSPDGLDNALTAIVREEILKDSFLIYSILPKSSETYFKKSSIKSRSLN